MVRSSVASKLTSVDDLFTTQAERDEEKLERVVEIPLDEISDFHNHPFKVKQDESMMEMVESVRHYGVLVPALVRPKPDGGYEMVAGHRRKMACALAERAIIPCVVRELTDDEAVIIMVDSNLQRETVLPSEKAFAYKMKLEAIRRSAGRPRKGNSRQVVGNLESADVVGEAAGESGRTIQRYIRLTNLVPPLLKLVDEGRIAFSPAVELSYLTKEEQAELWDLIEQEDATPFLSQAIRMKQFSRMAKLTPEAIYAIISEEKPNQKEQIRIKTESLKKYFPSHYSTQQMEKAILKLLEERYRSKHRGQER